MKKIFALLLSVAMIATLFVGVAFAATTASVRLNVKSVISTGSQFGTYRITGVVVANSGQVIDQTFTLNVNGVDVADVEVLKGRIDYVIQTNVEPKELEITAYNVNYPIADVVPATFTVKYAVTLDSALNYTYSANAAQAVITGTVKDATGKAINAAAVKLHWVNDDGVSTGLIKDGGVTTLAGQFGFIVPTWTQAGKIGLFVDGVLHNTGEVKAITMTLKATPNNNIVHTVADTAVKFELSGGPASGNLSAKVMKGTTTVVPNAVVAVMAADGTAEWTYTGNFATHGAGTYTVTATIGNYSAETTITVVAPSKYTLVDTTEQLKEINVGTKNLVFGTNANDIKVVETLADGTIKVQAVQYQVYVDGKLSTTVDKVLSGTHVITTTGLGSKTVKIVAWVEGATPGTFDVKLYETTLVVPVVGWEVSYDVNTLTVGETKTITFTVKDKDGNPVNNAAIYFGATSKVSGAATNIQNGVYVVKDVKYTTPQDITISVQKQDGTVMASFTAGLKVLGSKVYGVTANASALLVGKAQKITFTVTEGTATFIPDQVKIQVGTAAAVDAPTITPVDSDNDGMFDSFHFTYTATGTKDIIIRPMNATGTKIGEVVLQAVAPKLVAEGNAIATEDINTALTFKVVDPRDNSALTSKVKLAKNQFATMTLTDTQKRPLDATLVGASSYSLSVLASGATYKAAAEAEEEVEVQLTIELATGVWTPVDGTFLVKKAVLSSNPASIIIGQANNITLTYADANGNVLADKKVYLGEDANGTLVGTTDAAGQVNYAVAQGATTAVKFAAATDVAANFAKLTVSSTFDNVAPVVTAPATVDGTTAVITIKDNVRVARVMVNGVEVNIFPMPEIKHVVTVKSGVNTFNVVAMDANYNVVETTVTITSNAFTPVVITLGKANPAIGLDVAATTKSGRTMVPFRWFGEQILGATVNYAVVGSAEVVTLVKGDKTVELTLNSTIAKVNGAAVALDVAAYADGGRTLVPARFLAETFGYTIAWDSATNNVTISK